MGWLKRKIKNWLTSDDSIIESSRQPIAVSTDNIRDHNNGLNFCVYPAIGGKIVEVRSYNRKIDRNEGNLHIIREDEDFAESIGKIVYYETLRHQS